MTLLAIIMILMVTNNLTINSNDFNGVSNTTGDSHDSNGD